MTLSKSRERLVARLHRRRTREREGMVLVEGLRGVGEALDCDADIRFAVASPRCRQLGGDALLERLRARGVEVAEVNEGTMRFLADTDAPQGLLAVCTESGHRLDDLLDGSPRLLLLDGVQDPGNAGTLVRTAAAFGLDAVVFLDGTVEAWNPKTVRASAGTVFRIPVVGVSWDDAGPTLAAAGLPLRAADAAGRPVPRNGFVPPWALAVGSEGAGCRAEVVDASTERIAVPMPGGTESLNVGVAGAILMYAFTGGGQGA